MNDIVTFGLKRNIANGVIWLFSCVSGLIFYVSEKEDYKIRHNAMQSIIYGILMILVSGASWLPLVGGIFDKVRYLLYLGWLALVIINFIGKDIEIPVLSDLAKNFVK